VSDEGTKTRVKRMRIPDYFPQLDSFRDIAAVLYPNELVHNRVFTLGRTIALIISGTGTDT
jgi:hypothetical protein